LQLPSQLLTASISPGFSGQARSIDEGRGPDAPLRRARSDTHVCRRVECSTAAASRRMFMGPASGDSSEKEAYVPARYMIDQATGLLRTGSPET